jgi:chromosome segregation ATPase
MARTGLYKSEVKRARDALIAQHINPSVDAVRVALGNTGSKTTIHKYLKELEEDGGADGRKASVSEALQDLVARLAAQLHDEANAGLNEVHVQSVEQRRQHAEVLTTMQKEVEALSAQLQRADTAVAQEAVAHGRTRESLQNESISRHTAEQQVADLKERLAENEAHSQSLEEKHKHARDSLEHFRQSVKEQRDQDQRRHEQQIQQLQAEMRQLQQSLIVKQDEVTRLNQEGARLVGDLSHAQKQVYDQQSSHRQLEQKLESQHVVEQRNKALETLLSEKDIQAQSLSEQIVAGMAKAEALAGQIRDLELALAAAHAKIEAQQGFATEFRAYLDARGPTEGNAGKLNLTTFG